MQFDLSPIYQRIRQNLIDRRNHVARIIGGAACEQWFSAETFVALNWCEPPVLPADYTAVAENRKRDLIICDREGRCVAAIECKVGYNNKDLPKAIETLAKQTMRDALNGEVPDCSHGALVYLIWQNCFAQQETDFLAAAVEKLKHLFPASRFRHLASIGADTVIPPVKPWPTEDYTVSLHTYFVQRIC